jgi:hypothetical protein
MYFETVSLFVVQTTTTIGGNLYTFNFVLSERKLRLIYKDIWHFNK